jgi:hypothetical protein
MCGGSTAYVTTSPDAGKSVHQRNNLCYLIGKILNRIWEDTLSFIQTLNLKRAEALAHDSESWRLPLERLRGQVGDDGVERVTTQRVLDLLEIPQRARRAGTYRRLAKLMTELGWSAVRVRGPTRGGYLEQCRGFSRDARDKAASA